MNGEIPTALAYDDVLLVPCASSVLPSQVRLETRLTRGIALKIPLLSSAMDTVTGAATAVVMAREGGLGVIHRNLAPEAQAAEVRQVKSAEVPRPAAAAVDAEGRLLAAAAVGVGADCDARVALLVAAESDAIVVDTAHGHSQQVVDTVARLRQRHPQLALVAGNVATAAATAALAAAGADVVKVGIGPGSICTTRVVTGVGVPQITALLECAPAAAEGGVTLIADGGIKYAGDVAKALATGARAVMVGGMLAGTDEAPGELCEVDGVRFKAYRGMGSLGAMSAGSRDRYFQDDVADAGKLVPEGIEGRVPYRGPLAGRVFQLMGGLRSAMGYVGAADIEQLAARARFVRVTGAGLREGHVHDVTIAKRAPNYGEPGE